MTKLIARHNDVLNRKQMLILVQTLRLMRMAGKLCSTNEKEEWHIWMEIGVMKHKATGDED